MKFRSRKLAIAAACVGTAGVVAGGAVAANELAGSSAPQVWARTMISQDGPNPGQMTLTVGVDNYGTSPHTVQLRLRERDLNGDLVGVMPARISNWQSTSYPITVPQMDNQGEVSLGEVAGGRLESVDVTVLRFIGPLGAPYGEAGDIQVIVDGVVTPVAVNETAAPIASLPWHVEPLDY